MNHTNYLTAFCLCCFVSLPAIAADPIVVGQPCSQIGASLMTSNRQDIAVCLENSSGDLVWKASTNSSSSDMCGLTIIGLSQIEDTYTSGKSNHVRTWYYETPYNISPCNDQDITTNYRYLYRNNYKTTWDTACPSGYEVITKQISTATKPYEGVGREISMGATVAQGVFAQSTALMKIVYCKKKS